MKVINMSHKVVCLAILVQLCTLASLGLVEHELEKKNKIVNSVSVFTEYVTGGILMTEMISYHISAEHTGNFHDCKRCKQIVIDKEKDTLDYYENND